jgi:addiction module HigA family antidote
MVCIMADADDNGCHAGCPREEIAFYHRASEALEAMKNPPHVGGLIRRQVIEPLGLTVTEAAKVLGVGRQALSSLLNGKAALTSEMGLRVEKAFGPKMEHLMRMQLAFDLAHARKAAHEVRVKRFVAKRAEIIGCSINKTAQPPHFPS